MKNQPIQQSDYIYKGYSLLLGASFVMLLLGIVAMCLVVLLANIV